jgi:hypothetical protein
MVSLQGVSTFMFICHCYYFHSFIYRSTFVFVLLIYAMLTMCMEKTLCHKHMSLNAVNYFQMEGEKVEFGNKPGRPTSNVEKIRTLLQNDWCLPVRIVAKVPNINKQTDRFWLKMGDEERKHEHGV